MKWQGRSVTKAVPDSGMYRVLQQSIGHDVSFLRHALHVLHPIFIVVVEMLWHLYQGNAGFHLTN